MAPDLIGVEDRLRTAIRRKGSLRSVVDTSGVPKGTIENILRGTKTSFHAFAAVARAVDVTLDWLAFGVEGSVDTKHPEMPETIEEAEAEAAAPKRLRTISQKLTDEQRVAMLDAIISMALDPVEQSQIGPWVKGFITAALNKAGA